MWLYWISGLLPPANEVWGKVISLQASVCTQGGVPDQVHPPGPGTTPRSRPPWSRHPPDQTPQDQVHPYPLRTRYTPFPQTRYIPLLGPGTASPGPDPPGPDTPLGLGTPPGLGIHPPGTKYIPLGLSTHPLGLSTHPGTKYTPRTKYTPQRRACWEIRSTRGRYAFYWNAILVGYFLHWRIQGRETRDECPISVPFFFSFPCSFGQKSCQIIEFASNSGVDAPRLGNPGSATVLCIF